MKPRPEGVDGRAGIPSPPAFTRLMTMENTR
jgi:hypothetical protein